MQNLHFFKKQILFTRIPVSLKTPCILKQRAAEKLLQHKQKRNQGVKDLIGTEELRNLIFEKFVTQERGKV